MNYPKPENDNQLKEWTALMHTIWNEEAYNNSYRSPYERGYEEGLTGVADPLRWKYVTDVNQWLFGWGWEDGNGDRLANETN